MTASSRASKQQKLTSGALANTNSFDYLIVLDFEATCDETKRGQPRYRNEIIEFPSVVIDVKKRQVIDQLEQFVKPHLNPKLTPFCQELTSITQEQVDGGVTFAEAFRVHQALVAKYPNSCLLSCGDWDLKTMLPLDALGLQIQVPNYYKSWINLKVPFASLYRQKDNRGGMEAMLQRLGLQLVGTHHRGVDDCINIAQIANRMLQDGWKPEVTSRKDY